MGPIDWMLIEFDQPLTGKAAPPLLDLVDRGLITVLDVMFIRKLSDGSVQALEISDLPGDEAVHVNVFDGLETGMLGAPREGEPQDWAGRSNLWQAILMDHAKTGYFDMPARGGKSELPDDIVSAAAEYMLEETFPNRPED